MDLKDRFSLFVYLSCEESFKFFAKGIELPKMLKPDSDFTDLPFFHSQGFHGIVDMDITVSTSRSGDAFEDAGNFELLPVDRPILIRSHNDDRISNLPFHTPCEQIGD